MYATPIDTYVKDSEAKERMFEAIQHYRSIRAKAQWAEQGIGQEEEFVRRLIAFAAVEGIMFSSSFCAMYWVKKPGTLPGLTYSNELIARDEGLHTDFACCLFSKLEKKPPRQIKIKIIREAVAVEETFVEGALPDDILGINQNLMQQYVPFVADRLANMLGIEKIFKEANPFEWMEMISLRGRVIFFEKRVGEYQKAGILHPEAKKTSDEGCLEWDMDF